MEKEKKPFRVFQGTGENKIEMNVLVTQEEIEKMDEIKKQSLSNWEGRDLELLQEARKWILNNATNEKHNCKKTKKSTPINVEARNSSRNGFFVLWAAKNEIHKTKSILRLEEMRRNGEKEGLAFIRGLSSSNSYDLIPFNRLVYSLEVITLCKTVGQNKSLDETQQLLHKTMIIYLDNNIAYGDRITELERFGQNTPRILIFVLAIGYILFVIIKRELDNE